MAALTSVRWDEIEWQVRALAGATDAADPNTTTMQRWGNLVLNKMVRLLSFDKPWGRNQTATLTRQSSVGTIIQPSSGGSYTNSTKTIAKAALGLDQTYVGGWAFLFNTSNSAGGYGLIDTVASGGASCVLRFYNAISAADIANANFLCLLKPNPVFYEGVVSNSGAIALLDLVKVLDATNGNAIRLDSDDFASANPYANANPNVNYASSVMCEYAGDAIYLAKGTSVSSYGNITVVMDERPDAITAASSQIDLLPEHHQMFVEELTRWALNYIRKPIPQNLENPLRTLEEQYKQSAKDLALKMSKKFVPAQRA